MNLIQSISTLHHLPRLWSVMFAVVFALTTWSSHAAETKQLYTCGMHPAVIQDNPGNCPICGMKLTPIKGGGSDNANPFAIAVDAATRQNMNLRTAEVERGPLRKTIRTLGTIDYNETTLADVTTKFKGWIEKLHVDSTGRLVHRGETLFEVYSPELYSAQSELVLALNLAGDTNASGNTILRETAIQKLKYFDITDEQIAELEKSRQPRKTLSVTAPISGFIIEKEAVQGRMVDAGMNLYRIADLGIVWVIAQVYEPDLPFVKLGQEAVVRVASLPDREFHGRVTYIYPTVDEMTRTAKVRLEFQNPGYFLKPGMFVSAQIEAELAGSVVLVPDSAVLRSGARNTVFMAVDEGKFEAREVTLGVEGNNGQCEVIKGLTPGERVVTSGQFLLDSESQLREAIEKMRGPTKPDVSGAAPAATNAPTETGSTIQTPVAGTSFYVCPMPEHVSITYNHAGKCPICDMTLVSATRATLDKITGGGKVLHYTCPMPEHASVQENKPGKCPLCGMTLIPVAEKKVVAKVELPPLYTCPMKSDADVVLDKPGICPKCEMELVPVSTVKHQKLAEENWLKQHKH